MKVEVGRAPGTQARPRPGPDGRGRRLAAARVVRLAPSCPAAPASPAVGLLLALGGRTPRRVPRAGTGPTSPPKTQLSCRLRSPT